MDIDLPYNIDMTKGKKKKVVQGNNKETERKDKQKGTGLCVVRLVYRLGAYVVILCVRLVDRAL